MSIIDQVKRLFTPNAGHYRALEAMVDHQFDEGGGKYEAYLEFEDNYPASFDGSLEEEVKEQPIQRRNVYQGRNVYWIGERGRMLRVDPEYAEHISGNIFDPEKLASVAAAVELHPDPIFFYAPYGEMVKITLDRVRESIDYTDEGDEERLTTGDDELDEYLVDPGEYIDTYADEGEEDELRQEMEERLQEAVDDDEGDLGSWLFIFRDGNHRAFGSLAGGEPYVWAILNDNQYQYLVEVKKSGTMTDDERELLDMLA